MERYDVVVVGCGPAGIFSALELVRKSDLKVLMVDKGPNVPDRRCFVVEGKPCANCPRCFLLSGWGGAGAFSDGKLTLSTSVGGWLSEYLGNERLAELVRYVDGIYLELGAPHKTYGKLSGDEIESLCRRASVYDLKLVPNIIRHMGTETCSKVLVNAYEKLKDKVDVFFNREVRHILVKDNRAEGVEFSDGGRVYSRYTIVAPGRAGAEWLKREADRLGIKTTANPVDIGVRVETAASVLEELTDVLYEPKLVYYSKTFDDEVRTFCFNPYGEVIMERYSDVITVNGQSFLHKKTDNTNFAILVRTRFTEPFKDPIAYGKYIARLANIISGGIIIQRLVDLEMGRRSTEERIARAPIRPTLSVATPGDIGFVLPYRFLCDIKEMLKAMDKLAPGLYSKKTFLYGIEVKFYSVRPEVNANLETKQVKNLFTIGDGAGISRGLVQASVSGVVAAREILKREGID